MIWATRATSRPATTRSRRASAWSGGSVAISASACRVCARSTTSSAVSGTAAAVESTGGAAIGTVGWRASVRVASAMRCRAMASAHARKAFSSPWKELRSLTIEIHVSEAMSSAALGARARRYLSRAGCVRSKIRPKAAWSPDLARGRSSPNWKAVTCKTVGIRGAALDGPQAGSPIEDLEWQAGPAYRRQDAGVTSSTSNSARILTPDQRPRVFISSTLQELASERMAARDAIDALRLIPVMFELGARPHPARALYRAYLAQSHVFVGVYYERYGWVAPGEQVSGLEDEYLLSGALPRLVYLKAPAPAREPRLNELVDRIRDDDSVAYKTFATAEELAALLRDDLAVLLGEHFLLDQAAATADAAHPAAVTSSLPPPVSSLLGRGAEIAELDSVLKAGPRLVTVVGPGGIGKSPVALAAAERWSTDGHGSVAFVPLESVEDPADVLPAVASAIGLGLDRGVPALDALAAAFGARPYLLLLDNVEQVLEAAPDIAALLSRCPGVAVLATSRAALRLRGERLAPLGPLTLPVDDAAASVHDSAAVQLFVERAREVDPGFSLEDPADAAAVAELCRRLDGLPLAVEIAAARSRVLPPRALLQRIGSALDVGAGAADLPARQRTIRDTLAWSEQLLTDDQQHLLARLALFAAPWTLADAEAVSGVGAARHGPGD